MTGKIKLYDVFITRQLGSNAPLLFKIETVSAKSVEEAREKGQQECLRYSEQSGHRYTYDCKVTRGDGLLAHLNRRNNHG